MRRIAACVAIVLIAGSAVAQQSPTFRSNVRIVSVQTAAFDASGQPVADLRPSDFVAKVDGKIAPVLLARFAGSRATGRAAPPSPADRFVSASTVTPGRNVIVILDEESMSVFAMRGVLDATCRLVESLPSADAVGFLGLKGFGAIELTRDHAAVIAELRRLMGDSFSFDTFLKLQASNPLPPRQKLVTLEGVLQRASVLRGPKYVVWFAGSLPPRDADTTPFYARVARLTAQANVSWSTVYMGVPEFNRDADSTLESGDAARRRTFSDSHRDEGLRDLTAAMDGTFYSGQDGATQVFERLQAELDAAYEIGIDFSAVADDERPHRIDLAVTRPAVTLRLRREVVRSRAAPDDEALGRLLHERTDVADIPLSVSTYVVRGPSRDQVNVVVAVELPDSAARPVQWAASLSSGATWIAGVRQQTAEHRPTETALVTAPEGAYDLHVAAIDAAGRATALHLPFKAALHVAEDLALGDLFLTAGRSGAVNPTGRVPAGGGLSAAAEVYGEDVIDLDPVTGRLVVIRMENDAEMASTEIRGTPAADQRRLLLAGTLDTSHLPAGEYLARLDVLSGARKIGEVRRVFTVVNAEGKHQ